MTRRVRGAFALLLLGAATAAVIGRSAPAVNAQIQSVDPCSSVPMPPAGVRTLMSSALAQAAQDAKRERVGHDDRWRHLDSLWADRAAAARRPLAAREVGAVVDVGDIAVLQDAGELMVMANPLDLTDVALRLAPNGGGGYDVVRDRYGFREPLGTPLALTDDDTRAVTLPFAFPFYGRTHTQLFVNSDGNLTFGAADVASTERSVSRLLTDIDGLDLPAIDSDGQGA